MLFARRVGCDLSRRAVSSKVNDSIAPKRRPRRGPADRCAVSARPIAGRHCVLTSCRCVAAQNADRGAGRLRGFSEEFGVEGVRSRSCCSRRAKDGNRGRVANPDAAGVVWYMPPRPLMRMRTFIMAIWVRPCGKDRRQSDAMHRKWGSGHGSVQQRSPCWRWC